MNLILVIIMLSLVGGVSGALFSTERNRNQAAWFAIGGLTGPVGVLILLLLPVLPERTEAKKAEGTLLAVLIVVGLSITACLLIFEMVSRYQAGERYADLATWDLYGDALIHMGRAEGYPEGSFVVKAARNQLAEHQIALRAGMRRTEDELLLAVRGVREVKGAIGIMANVYRLLTLRRPIWPAPISLSTTMQKTVIHNLEIQLARYRDALDAIGAAQENWQPKQTAPRQSQPG